MGTILIRGLYTENPAQQGVVLTLGNFDGVHLGHQQLIKAVVAEANAKKVPSVLMTFEPHPAEYFSQIPVTRLTRFTEKFRLLSHLNLDAVAVLRFNQQLAEMSASHFFNDIIWQRFRPCRLVVGEDFRFGYKREGDVNFLIKEGAKKGMSVCEFAAVNLKKERISSTRVRQALKTGDHELVAALLGRRYSMYGCIEHGNALGRQLGFRTANIHVHRKLTPLSGIFTVLMYGIDEKPLPGVANIGTRPTIDGTRTLLEVHLLDFDQDIYGQKVTVEFCTKLREEIRYPNLELLKLQIGEDVKAAKEYFNQHGVS